MLQAGSLLPPPEQAMTPDEIYEVSSMLGRANESNPDPSAALACGTATMLALYSREKTGKGQYVETTMLCGNLYANGDDCLSYEGKPKRAAMDRDMNGLQATYRLYECAEGWVFLACPGPKEWEVFARAAGLDGLLSDERFSTSESRAANDGEMAAFTGAGIPAKTGAGVAGPACAPGRGLRRGLRRRKREVRGDHAVGPGTQA